MIHDHENFIRDSFGPSHNIELRTRSLPLVPLLTLPPEIHFATEPFILDTSQHNARFKSSKRKWLKGRKNVEKFDRSFRERG